MSPSMEVEALMATCCVTNHFSIVYKLSADMYTYTPSTALSQHITKYIHVVYVFLLLYTFYLLTATDKQRNHIVTIAKQTHAIQTTEHNKTYHPHILTPNTVVIKVLHAPYGPSESAILSNIYISTFTRSTQ